MEKTIEAQRLITADEFEHLITQPENSDRLLELIHGEIVEKMTGLQHSEIAGFLIEKLRSFVIPRKLGRVGVELHHRNRNVGDEMNYRIPDVSYTAGRVPLDSAPMPRMPDLAVEIRSPGDAWGALHEKAGYYLAHGTQMVILVDPLKRRVIVRTQGGETALYEKDVLDLGPVLPGLTIVVKDIFADPLADDAEAEPSAGDQ